MCIYMRILFFILISTFAFHIYMGIEVGVSNFVFQYKKNF